MPNWCYNTVKVSHEDSATIEKFVKAINESNLFNTFLPMPEELHNATSPSKPNQELIDKYGHSDWYSWSVVNWGTKWEITESYVSDVSEDKLSVTASFNTAWNPPIQFYDTMLGFGFDIDATYTEEGMGYAGRYLNGEDRCIDLDFDETSQEWIDKIDDNVLRSLIQDEYDSWLSYSIEIDL